jgi:hypothetical protein
LTVPASIGASPETSQITTVAAAARTLDRRQSHARVTSPGATGPPNVTAIAVSSARHSGEFGGMC